VLHTFQLVGTELHLMVIDDFGQEILDAMRRWNRGALNRNGEITRAGMEVRRKLLPKSFERASFLGEDNGLTGSRG